MRRHVFLLLAALVLPLGLAAAGSSGSTQAAYNFRQAQSLYLAGDLDAAAQQALLAMKEDPATPGLGDFYRQLVQEQKRLKQVNLGASASPELSNGHKARQASSPGAWGRIWEALYGLRDSAEAHWGELEGKVDSQAQEQQLMTQDLVRLQDSITQTRESGTRWTFWVLVVLFTLLLILMIQVGVLMRMRKSLSELRVEVDARRRWASGKMATAEDRADPRWES